ncbi:MAG: hypothetical protein ABI626_04820 [Sphingomicrobium sp.]
MIWLALAAQLSAPVPTNDLLVRPADVPLELLRADEMKLVQFRITVTPAGKSQDCQIELSSGNPKIDAMTCSVIKRRAHFRPATDVNGNAAYGVYRAFITWWMGDNSKAPPSVTTRDLDITVKTLPRGVQSPVPVKLMIAVDADGHPSSCKGERATDNPGLVEAGCGQLVKAYTAVPARSSTGTLVPSVQTATVLFMKG